MGFKDILIQNKIEVEKELNLFFDNKISKEQNTFLKTAYNFTRDYVANGGKRLRPIALIMAYKAFGGKNTDICKTSTAVELFHNSTLVHDDVMDNDDLRRGKPTLHKRFGEYHKSSFSQEGSGEFGKNEALCMGNKLEILGNNILNNSAFPSELKTKAIDIYDNAYDIVNDGQKLDILFEHKIPSEQEYFDMLTKKTANLFKASIEIGATLANAPEEHITALKEYIVSAALAFQLKDDLMDLTSEKGHKPGSDIRKGKNTLLIIKALESAEEEQKRTLSNIKGNENSTHEQIEEVIEIMNQTGAINYVETLAESYIQEAKQSLSQLEGQITPESFDFFNGFADFMFKRNK